jgi:U6 snRNA-associated Sm-like protein LSm6
LPTHHRAQPKKSPSDFLKGVIGRPVTVRLSSGVDYKGACRAGRPASQVRPPPHERGADANRAPTSHATPFPAPRTGILVCLDGFMNIALEQTEEWVDGVLRSKFGDCFIRGNNGACGGGWESGGVCGACA